jgi:hypothetical protein
MHPAWKTLQSNFRHEDELDQMAVNSLPSTVLETINKNDEKVQELDQMKEQEVLHPLLPTDLRRADSPPEAVNTVIPSVDRLSPKTFLL